MKIYKETNVFEEAQKRISFLFDEFEEVIVSVSGGKDSTVIYNLALMEAERRGRLPLSVMFIDQEVEWEATIDEIELIMTDPRVKPYWYQVPIRIFNATSYDEDWLHCWREGDTWMREKHPISIKENPFNTDRFKPFFTQFLDKTFKGRKVCSLTGIRGAESPSRWVGITQGATYKHITWGKRNTKNQEHYNFHPIYDWDVTDVWHAIHSNGWSYNRVYDYMYQYGVPINQMRVSNLNHETALNNLYFLQEIEPKTWEMATMRLHGISTTGHVEKRNLFSCPREVPFMFKDWIEYRDYLLEKLVTDPEKKQIYEKEFERCDRVYLGSPNIENLFKTEITAILNNDYHFTKLGNFLNKPDQSIYKKIRKGEEVDYPKFEKKILGKLGLLNEN